MAELKQTLSEIQGKWGEVTPGRIKYYKAGIEKNTTWENNTSGAKEIYGAAITAPDIPDRFDFGVRKTGLSGWKKKTSDKGVPVWAGRVKLGAPDYGKEFGDYYTEIGSLKGTEPARFPKGDPRNLERVGHYATGLRKLWETKRGIAS